MGASGGGSPVGQKFICHVEGVEKMTNYRIQLASNFQVVEFNLEIDEDKVLSFEDERISNAVDLVNKLGEVVVNTIKSKGSETKVTTEEMATEKQKELLKKFGFSNVKNFTKKEATETIKEFINVNKG